MNKHLSEQGRAITKCEFCGESLTEYIEEFSLPLSPGNPYPDSIIVCKKSACVDWAYSVIEDEFAQLNECDDEEEGAWERKQMGSGWK